MAVEVIDKIKPKNGGSFPIVEAVDVEVSDGLRLPEALAAKAGTSTTDNLQAQVDQIAQSAGTGTADTEIAQARVDAEGVAHTTLKERIDATETATNNAIVFEEELVKPVTDFKNLRHLWSVGKVRAKAVGSESDVDTTNNSYVYVDFSIDYAEKFVLSNYEPILSSSAHLIELLNSDNTILQAVAHVTSGTPDVHSTWCYKDTNGNIVIDFTAITKGSYSATTNVRICIQKEATTKVIAHSLNASWLGKEEMRQYINSIPYLLSKGVVTSSQLADCNSAEMNSIVFINDITVDNLPESTTGMLITISRLETTQKTGAFQIFVANNNSTIYYRVSVSATTWSDWKKAIDTDDLQAVYDYVDSVPAIVSKGVVTSTDLSDCNNAEMNSVVFVNDRNVLNLPVQSTGTLITISRLESVQKTGVIQMYFTQSDKSNVFFHRVSTSSSTWGDWVKVVDTSNIEEIVTAIFSQQDYIDISLFEKIGVIGDSWASGVVYPSGVGNNYYNISWPQIIARSHGITATNFSKGGLSTRTWLEDTRGLALLNSETAKNLYVIALGINDATEIDNETMPLGTINDINVADSSQNANTFYGYYGKIVSAVIAKAPTAKIILSTIPRSDKATYATLNEAILEIAELFSIAYVVALEDSFFTSDFFVSGRTEPTAYSHPTAPLYSGMAKAYDRLISKCMIDQYDYFKDYYD